MAEDNTKDTTNAPSGKGIDTSKDNAPTTDNTVVAENDPTVGDEHVVQHLDRDPNDPRNAAPTPQLPSLDDKQTQGPEHGRVSNEDDQTDVGQNGPKV